MQGKLKQISILQLYICLYLKQQNIYAQHEHLKVKTCQR